MSNLKKFTFAIYLKVSGLFWYLPLVGIFVVAQQVSITAFIWLFIFSVFPLAYAFFGYLQAEHIAAKLEASKSFAFIMSCLSLLGGGAIQGIILALYSGDVDAIIFTVGFTGLFGLLPSLFVAVLFIGLCENA